MAALVPPSSVEDFEDNDEAVEAGIEDEDDVDDLLEEHGLLGLTLEYRAASEAVVRWINEEYTNEHTNQDYRTALRSFGRYRLKRDEPPETLDWIPTGTSTDFDPVPSERDQLTYDDLQAMVEDGARNPETKRCLPSSSRPDFVAESSTISASATSSTVITRSGTTSTARRANGQSI